MGVRWGLEEPESGGEAQALVLPARDVMFIREKVGFTEKTAKRHRWGGRREVTVTSKLTHSNIET